jgi:hypothetical protein
MFKLDTTTMPKELKDNIRVDVVEKHAATLAEKGVSYSAELAKAAKDLTGDEKALIAFYAVSIAVKSEEYSKAAKLIGLAIYGFAAMKNFALADDFIAQTTMPQAGGTTHVFLAILTNLKYLERGVAAGTYDADVGEWVKNTVPVVQAKMWESMFELLLATDACDLRENKVRIREGFISLAFLLLRVVLISGCVWALINIIQKVG